MKFIKAILLFCLCGFCVLAAAAQDSVYFKIKYLPNHKYVSTTKMVSEITMNMVGKKEYMNRIKKSGMQLPMVMKGENFLNFSVKTGSPDDKSSFPIVLKYNDTWSKQTVNGKALAANQSPLFGQSIYGHSTADGKLEVDSIPSKKISDTLKLVLAKVLNNISQQIKFPDKPLHIGEKFTQEVPFSMPVSGITMDMAIKIVYTYVGNKDDVAKFDVAQNMTYNFSKKDTKATITGDATGKGTGVLEYYIGQNMIKNYNSDLAMVFKMGFNDMTMTGKANISSSNSFTISQQ